MYRTQTSQSNQVSQRLKCAFAVIRHQVIKMCSRLMMSGPFGLSCCWFAGVVFVLGDLMLCCLQSSSFSSSFPSSSKELLTCEPTDQCLDQLKGMSSCKLQLHHTLWINCGCGVIGEWGGVNAYTDREAPPSHVRLCQSSSRETEEGVCVCVCGWISRSVMVSKGMFATSVWEG